MRPIELNFVAQGLMQKVDGSLHVYIPAEVFVHMQAFRSAKFQCGLLCTHDKRRDRQRDVDDSKLSHVSNQHSFQLLRIEICGRAERVSAWQVG